MANHSINESQRQSTTGTSANVSRWQRARHARRSNATSDVRENYRQASELTGPLTLPTDGEALVQFRQVLSPSQRFQLAAMIFTNIAFGLTFLAILLLPRHFPANHDPFGRFGSLVSAIAFILVALIETLRLVQNATLWLFAWNMRDPVPFVPQSNLRIAVLTTIVPSKEPVELVAETLRAMRQIEYDGTVDVWILDEEDDPEVRSLAAETGVHHFSRKGQRDYNQPSGPFRTGRKSGNHNAWRNSHEHQYDLVAQMDPDHVPLPPFLNRTVGYFRDPDVAFVVAPQVYGNLEESFVTHGAADQSYLFHGVVQRGGNNLGAPLLIGTNHVYRVSTWKQIGGYQDSVIEDHLTSLRVHQTRNPLTRNLWKGIYTPDVLSIGEGPRSWTDYFNQQYRWSFGIGEIVVNHALPLLRAMPIRRIASYFCLEFFYPSVALLWLLGTLVTALYLVFGITAIDISPEPWLGSWLPTVLLQFAFFVYLRRFNLARHERTGTGIVGLLLSLACGPIYVVAGLSALLRRPYSYVVTAKATLTNTDSRHTFRLHFACVIAVAFMLAASVVHHNNHWALRLWAIFVLLCASLPVVGHAAGATRRYRQTARLARPAEQCETATEEAAGSVGSLSELEEEHDIRTPQFELLDDMPPHQLRTPTD